MPAPLPAPPPSDHELVERFARGERSAFDELVKRHERAIFLYAYRTLRHVEDARDVAQRTFVQAFSAIGRFRGDSEFRTWIFRIAINLSQSALRSRGRAQRFAAESAPPEAVEPSLPLPEREAERLRQSVAELPPKQRLIVELRVFHDLSFQEVAELAGSSEDAAKANFHHAIKRLRERYRKEER